MPVVTVVSTNNDLINLCLETLREFDEFRWRLMLGRETACQSRSDLRIWDYEAGQELPPTQASVVGTDLYFVDPAVLGGFRARFPSAEGKILLKPVSRVVLRAFLSSIVASDRDHLNGRGDAQSERDLLLERAQRVNLKLQQYDGERAAFLARAAHDLRTPLTALAGFSGLLASEQLGPMNPLQKEVLTRMEHTTKRIGQMANSLFQLSVGEKVQERPRREAANIHDCIEQAIHETTPMLQSKQISLSFAEIRDPNGPLLFDPTQLERVLVNLLDNASKMTPVDGSIKVRGYPYFWERRWLAAEGSTPDRRIRYIEAANSYRIDIQDNGPGVPKESLEEIFEEYARGAKSANYPGGGLGLAICKRILHLHSGRIWAEPQRDGALFSFVLPYGAG